MWSRHWPIHMCQSKSNAIQEKQSWQMWKMRAGYDSCLFDILNETLPFCDNLKDEKCNIDLLVLGFNQALTDCKMQCKITEYTAKISKLAWTVNQYGNRSSDIWILHSSASRTRTEEYLIYDEIGMIGNVGGSLGLFVGFSFFGAFSDCLDFLRSRNLFKQ